MSNALKTLLGSAEGALVCPGLLAEAATAPASPGEHDAGPVVVGLAAAGSVVLVIWLIRLAIKPRKPSLASSPGRPNSLTPIHILVPMLAWTAGGWGAKSLIDMTGMLGPAESGILTVVVAQTLWLAVALGAACTAFGLGLRRGMGLSARHWLWDSLRGIVAYLAVFPVCILLLKLTEYLLPGIRRDHDTLKAISTVEPAWQAVAAFGAIVMATLSEEVFFRGLVQSLLRKYFNHPWTAIIVTSLLFSAVHLGAPQTIPAIFALSVALGYNYERTGRLLPSIVIHVLFNAVFVAIYISNL